MENQENERLDKALEEATRDIETGVTENTGAEVEEEQAMQEIVDEMEEPKPSNEATDTGNLQIPALSKVNRANATFGKPIEKYPYINEEGEIQYEVWKMDKNSRQPYYVFRQLADKTYKAGLGKVDTIIYNLPAVLEAKKNGEVIIVTEGESKAKTFNELGYTATTVPFSGTDKWRSKYSRYLKHAFVIVVADNDDNGREFADFTFEEISDVTDNIAMLDLAELYPTLKEGGDINDLREVATDTQIKAVINEVIREFVGTEDKE